MASLTDFEKKIASITGDIHVDDGREGIVGADGGLQMPKPHPKKKKMRSRGRRATFHLHTKSSQTKYSHKLQDQYTRIKKAKEYNDFVSKFNAGANGSESNLNLPNSPPIGRRHSVLKNNTLAKQHETRHDYMRSIMEAEKNVKILMETKMHLNEKYNQVLWDISEIQKAIDEEELAFGPMKQVQRRLQAALKR